MEEDAKERTAAAERIARERIAKERFEAFSGSKAGERRVLTIAGFEYAFRWCPPGTFTMGNLGLEMARDCDETFYDVTLTKGFWMLETEVTQEMWESVIGSNPSRFKGDKRLPVDNVSWEDCQEFIKKLNASFSQSTLGAGFGRIRFSLPTEAQWEYACRAGTETLFHFGDELNGDKANCNGNKPYGTDKSYKIVMSKGPYLEKTSVVGFYPANAWGLCDMHGNVWEWCSNWYGVYPSSAVTDPVGPSSGTNRVGRGGSWYSSAWDCRSSSRHRGEILSHSKYYGYSGSPGLRLSLVSESE